ncbi:MAG: DUF1353 domain-containing protein [Proteobacteria bacterium]|nr:DUF1353 domain-containing protein [Pseudomonadota bacterium]
MVRNRKIVPNPYPSVKWKEVEFQYLEDQNLLLQRNASRVSHRALAVVCKNYEIHYTLDNGKYEGSIIVPATFITDGISIPKWATKLTGIKRWGKGIEAAVVHDYLYVAWQYMGKKRGPKRKDKKFADELFRAGLLAAGVSKNKTCLMYLASDSDTGWAIYKGKNHPEDTWYNGPLC